MMQSKSLQLVKTCTLAFEVVNTALPIRRPLLTAFRTQRLCRYRPAADIGNVPASPVCDNASLMMQLKLVVVPAHATTSTEEQTLNNVIMLRQFVVSIRPIFEALHDANSALLSEIRDVCSSISGSAACADDISFVAPA